MNYEQRREAAMDVLGAIILAMCVALPTALWWLGLI
jgi:hypothetical protein